VEAAIQRHFNEITDLKEKKVVEEKKIEDKKRNSYAFLGEDFAS